MKHRFTRPERLIIILSLMIAVLVIFLLSLWTRELSRKEESAAFESALRAFVNENGERALFEAAGIPVDSMHYSYEDLPLFSGEKPAWEYSEEDRRGISVFEKAAPSVVRITAMGDLQHSAEGSGVILSSDGYIITNKHVVGTAKAFAISFYDSSYAEAVLVGYDDLSDLALLKADATALPAIEIASSDDILTGETCYVIGHPFSYPWSMSKGIISGVDRLVADGRETIPSMIQTDAAINPGNSGGPLLDSQGRMIGLISRISTDTGSSGGVGFAIPSGRIMNSVKEIIDEGRVSRGWLDILSVELNPVIADFASIPVDKGIVVSQVVPGGEADRGGLRGGTTAVQYGQSVIYLGGDVITAIDGKPVEGYDDYFAVLFDTDAGDTVDITVLRDGVPVVLEDVTLIERTMENSGWIAR